MKIKQKLETLLHYYISTRQVGHTTLLKEGIENYKKDKLILSFNKVDHTFLNVKPSEIISWKGIQSHSLNGYNKPLAIDNGAMYILLEETLAEIDRLENKNDSTNNTQNLKINFEKLKELEDLYRKDDNKICMDLLHNFLNTFISSHEHKHVGMINLSYLCAINTLIDLNILNSKK